MRDTMQAESTEFSTSRSRHYYVCSREDYEGFTEKYRNCTALAVQSSSMSMSANQAMAALIVDRLKLFFSKLVHKTGKVFKLP
jgi:hypothetical protein